MGYCGCYNFRGRVVSYWHLTGRGQRYCWTSYNVQDNSLQQILIQHHGLIVLRLRNPGLNQSLSPRILVQSVVQEALVMEEPGKSKAIPRNRKSAWRSKWYKSLQRHIQSSLSQRSIFQAAAIHLFNKYLLSPSCGPGAFWALDSLTDDNLKNSQEYCQVVWFKNMECGAWRTFATVKRNWALPAYLFIV